MDILGPDVIQHLAQWLPQQDLLNLALTNKSFYSLLHPKIYEVVVVDSSRTQFDDIFSDSCHEWFVYHEYPCEPTVIRTLYSITRFFKNLIENPHYARYVTQFVVEENFPDVPEIELNQYLLQILPYMSNINVFSWSSLHYPIEAQLMSLFPNPERLQTLWGNFRFSESGFPCAQFERLHSLGISNFKKDKVLESIDMSLFASIKTLTISKKTTGRRKSFTSQLETCCQSSLSSTIEPLLFSERPTFISSLFNSPLIEKLCLTSLHLKDISLTRQDADSLRENINLQTLEHLSLDNCVECLFENSSSFPNINPSRRRHPPSELFLEVLSPDLVSLKLLNLNLSNELCFNRVTVRTISQLHGLQKLSIHIKVFKTDEQVNLAPIVNALQTHAQSLVYLNLCCDIVESSVSVCPKKNFRYALKSVIGLSALTKLQVLKLPISYNQIADFPKLLSSLENLKILQLGIAHLDCIPSKAACFGCDEYVLGSVNSLISDDYFKCSTSFSTRMEVNKNQQYLQFSKIFRSMFENLKFLRFDLRNESLLYDVSDKMGITAQNSSLQKFDMIVKMIV